MLCSYEILIVLYDSIKVVFSIGDIDAEQEDDDQVFANDEESEETDAATEGEAEDKAEPVEDDTSSFPVRAAITVTKAGAPGALSIDAVAQGEFFVVCCVWMLTRCRWDVYDRQHLFLQRC